uniref:ADAM metallopeptidase domain 28 n=1 Tax=Scleropages formosus TaxID=113540 RepID=A0A8C9U7P9_SCLFO
MPMPRWFLLSTASFRPELDGVKDYEVITPVRLHTLHRRDTQGLRHSCVLAAHTQDDCYYHGRIVNDSESTVSLSTCDGLRLERHLRPHLTINSFNPFLTSSIGDTFQRFTDALIGLEIWTDQDKISVTTPAGSTLDAFTNWRNNYLLKTKPHDNAHLISGIDFDGATVGLAYIGSLCTGHSTGVVQDHNSRAIAVGATLAHEMGHNLGMNHDSSSCICTGSTCIMSAALSYDIPENFSSCSDANYEQFLTSRNPPCLFNKPDYMSLISTPKCGNGFVENGEQCDCGTVEECKNPCCNATTCTLTAGSQCSAGDCCEDCKFTPPSRVCRRQQDECDLAEYCTGKSTECPEDVFTVNGLPCKGGQSYCYNGLCPTKADQCVKVWGSTAEVAKPSCYDQNTRGTYYAFCNRPSREQYIGCQKKDVMCGKLFCIEGNDNPNYNRFVKFLDCKAIFSDDPDNDFGQVDTGTKCGDGMVCKDHECVNLETAYRATNCSARCKGHAVCNHKQECQCEPGWLPPNCDSKEYTPLSPGTCVDSGFIYCQILPKCLISMKERRLMLPV